MTSESYMKAQHNYCSWIFYKYSASGKYSQCLNISTFFNVTDLFQNGFNSLVPSKFYKQYPIMTMGKKFVWNLCKFIKKKKKKKKKKSHVHKYSQSLLNIFFKHLWHQLQPQIFLGIGTPIFLSCQHYTVLVARAVQLHAQMRWSALWENTMHVRSTSRSAAAALKEIAAK